MPKSPALAAVLILCASAAAVAAERRELGAHQHGHGTLNLALEGNALAAELEAPGADIVGFEHEAKSASDKAALDKAMATLKQPLTLLSMPDKAQCTLKTAKVEFEHEDHDHDAHSAAKEKAAEAEHRSFHAQYEFDCKAPAELKAMSLGYFAAFKNAQGLTVSVITPKGQTTLEATREKPGIDLSGLN